MTGVSKLIITDQDGLHPNLEKTVRKHLAHPFQKPFAAFSEATFNDLDTWVTTRGKPVIIDSCCGIGESTRHIAQQFPDHTVIGIDKSANRLGRTQPHPLPQNAKTVRGDLNDLFRLIARSDWQIYRHFLLYPNPWPKAQHLGRRWHGAAVFPDLIKISAQLELRSNWQLYLQEFQRALEIAGLSSTLTRHTPTQGITPFERKFLDSGHPLWKLSTV